MCVNYITQCTIDSIVLRFVVIECIKHQILSGEFHTFQKKSDFVNWSSLYSEPNENFIGSIGHPTNQLDHNLTTQASLNWLN